MASEDQRFVEHHGIDFVSLDRALADYRGGDGLRGASTITQQVAKNVFLWQGRSFVRKALEAYFAVLLEMCWTKERILEVYLNVAEFGPGVFGVEAAAREYFDSSAAALERLGRGVARGRVAESAASCARRGRATTFASGKRGSSAQVRLLESRGHYRGLDW